MLLLLILRGCVSCSHRPLKHPTSDTILQLLLRQLSNAPGLEAFIKPLRAAAAAVGSWSHMPADRSSLVPLRLLATLLARSSSASCKPDSRCTYTQQCHISVAWCCPDLQKSSTVNRGAACAGFMMLSKLRPPNQTSDISEVCAGHSA
jgi:hypothetical protein